MRPATTPPPPATAPTRGRRWWSRAATARSRCRSCIRCSPAHGPSARRAHRHLGPRHVLRNDPRDAGQRLGQRDRRRHRGQWQVTLPAMAAGGPYQLVVMGAKQTVTLTNVMVGEVWLCSGQSNMAFPLSRVADAAAEIADGNDANLRFASVVSTASLAEENTVKVVNWQLSTATSVPGFSAVCFLMGRLVQRALNIPVGLISAAWSGTTIEAWISATRWASRDKPRASSSAIWRPVRT